MFNLVISRHRMPDFTTLHPTCTAAPSIQIVLSEPPKEPSSTNKFNGPLFKTQLLEKLLGIT